MNERLNRPVDKVGTELWSVLSKEVIDICSG